MRSISTKDRSARVHELFVGTVVLIMLASWLLVYLHPVMFDEHVADSTVLLRRVRHLLAPEPIERFVFLTLALVAPLGMFGAGLLVFRRPIAEPSNTKTWPALVLLTAAFMLYAPLTGFEIHFGAAIPHLAEYDNLVFVLPAVTLAMSCLWYGRVGTSASHPTTNDKGTTNFSPRGSGKPFQFGIWLIFFVLLTLQILSWRLLGERSVTQGGAWFDSADAVYYPVSQVMSGKNLLVDLPSQYGLFPLFLQPALKITGMSILGFTAVCAIMQICSLAAVHAVAQSVLRDKAIKITYALTLLAVTFGTISWLIGLDDAYFQYWPIRFFWPALSFFAVYRYSRKPVPWNAFFVSLAGAAGSLWNSDSGIVIVIAFAGLLAAKWVVLGTSGIAGKVSKRKAITRALLIHVATFFTCAALMGLWLLLGSKGSVNWGWLFDYQKIFYLLGFMMLPIPIYHSPWMSVAGIYLMGFAVAMQIWSRQPQSKTAELIVFLGLLGLGLFVYYQGRSHPLNLISVSWPAVTLMTILADRTLRGVRAGLLSRIHLAHPIAALSILILFSAVLLTGVPGMINDGVTAFKNRNQYADAIVHDELTFIRSTTRPGDECAILSLRQGLYHAATGLASPLAGPGYAGMLLQRDRDSLFAQLEKGHFSCVFAGVGKSSALHPEMELAAAMSRYEVISRSERGSMVLLRPITQHR